MQTFNENLLVLSSIFIFFFLPLSLIIGYNAINKVMEKLNTGEILNRLKSTDKFKEIPTGSYRSQSFLKLLQDGFETSLKIKNALVRHNDGEKEYVFVIQLTPQKETGTKKPRQTIDYDMFIAIALETETTVDDEVHFKLLTRRLRESGLTGNLPSPVLNFNRKFHSHSCSEWQKFQPGENLQKALLNQIHIYPFVARKMFKPDKAGTPGYDLLFTRELVAATGPPARNETEIRQGLCFLRKTAKQADTDA